MHARDKGCIQRILEGEPVLSSEKVRFDVNIGGTLNKGRVICTRTRLLLYMRTPMGMQATVVWYKEVECLTSGRKGGLHYAQLLGQGSRILVLFKSRKVRDSFKNLCAAHMSGAVT